MAKAAPEKKEAPVKKERVTANGIVRPKDGTSTGKVWAHADRISQATKAPAKRGEVLAACEKEGINPSTAATQFGRWCKFNGVANPRANAAKKEAPAKKETPAKKAPAKKEAPAEDEENFED